MKVITLVTRLRNIFLIAGFLMTPWVSQGQEIYPDKPIRLIVPFPPGGGADNLARAVIPRASQILGQSIIVENRPGAGGNVGSEMVARSAPDGYTLLHGTNGTHGTNHALYSKTGFDPIKDFVPITLIAKVPNVIAVSKASPYKNLADLVADAKKNPGKINYGSAGNGSAGHLAMEYFTSVAGIDLVHVPYKGSGAMLTDLIGGQIQATFNGLPSLIGQIKGSALVPLAVGSLARSSTLPQVPTLIELGYKGVETSQWYGLMAPAGTPKPIIDKLQMEVARALKSKDDSKKMLDDGAILVGDTPEQFDVFIRAEQKRWANVVEKAKISID